MEPRFVIPQTCSWSCAVLLWTLLLVHTAYGQPSHAYEPINYDRSDLEQLREHLFSPPARWRRSLPETSNAHWTQSNHTSDDDLFQQTRKRSPPPSQQFSVTFYAHERPFHLRLHTPHVNQVFAPDAVFHSTSRGKFHYLKNHVLAGHLAGEELDSEVEGVLTQDGLLDASIRSGHDLYYVEPAHRYSLNDSDGYHSIIYRLVDVPFQPFSCKDHRPGSVNSTMRSFTFDALAQQLPGLNEHWSRSKREAIRSTHNQNANRNGEYYWKEMDALHYNNEGYGVRAIQRTHWPGDTEQGHLVVDSRKSTCMLYLQADHLFYNRMGSEEACIETMIRHVQKVNSIYRVTDFDQDGRSDNISFLIKRIKVHTSEALKDADYRFPSNYGVERFLELFSEEDYDAFCLAYMFTYRDFEGGTLGLAWTGDLKNAGGVCEKNGHYRGSLKSLNTGIVTLLNYGKHVPPIVSHVTLAHEIGHNFGSPHDPEDDGSCTPGGENGNYIMFARATSGDKRNNNKFSPCSLKSVNAVLNTKARSLKGCFQEPQEAICGNEVVEPGEECDCGWEEDCTEPCCFPMRSNPPAHETPCKLRPGFICSPSQGPCCTQECRLKVGNKCRDDNGCRTASYCNGQGPACPLSTNKPNKTICNDEFVCYMGECTGSICIAYGLESCQCKKQDGDLDTKYCELCCRMPGDDSTCKSSFEWNAAPYDVPDLYAKPGTPCDNYHGYCDVTQHCREVHPSGPLATLRRFLLSDQSMAWLRSWLQHQWLYAAALCTLALLLCLLLLRALRRAANAQQQQAKASTIGQLGVAAATAAAFTTPLSPSVAAAAANAAGGGGNGQAVGNNSNSNNGYLFATNRLTSYGQTNSNTTGTSLGMKGTSASNYGPVSNHYGYIGAYAATYAAYDAFQPATTTNGELYGYTGYSMTGQAQPTYGQTSQPAHHTNQTQSMNNSGYPYQQTTNQQLGSYNTQTSTTPLQAHRQANSTGLYGVINAPQQTNASNNTNNSSSVYAYVGAYSAIPPPTTNRTAASGANAHHSSQSSVMRNAASSGALLHPASSYGALKGALSYSSGVHGAHYTYADTMGDQAGQSAHTGTSAIANNEYGQCSGNNGWV